MGWIDGMDRWDRWDRWTNLSCFRYYTSVGPIGFPDVCP